LDFHKKYNGKAKYSFNYLIDGHEPTTMVAKEGDELFLQYIKHLEENGILEDTMVLFFSDHG